jgi:hypothetical protein
MRGARERHPTRRWFATGQSSEEKHSTELAFLKARSLRATLPGVNERPRIGD